MELINYSRFAKMVARVALKFLKRKGIMHKLFPGKRGDQHNYRVLVRTKDCDLCAAEVHCFARGGHCSGFYGALFYGDQTASRKRVRQGG